MRLALVTDYYLPTLGGVQTAVKALREGLERAGHEVTVCCPGDNPSDDPGILTLPVSRVFRPDGYPFAWPPRKVRARLREEFAARGVQVVHTHSEMFAALSGVRVARELTLPVVHTMHGRIDVFTASVLPVPAVTARLLTWMHHRQVPHSGVRVEAELPYTATRVARRMWRLMIAQARASDHVVVPSGHFAQKLAEVGAQTSTTVVSNGIEPSVLAQIGEPQVRELAPGEPLRALWVGRLSPEKRPELFVAAVRRAGAGVQATMFGDGVARSTVARAADSVPVRLGGSVPQQEVLAEMQRSHVLVSSSLDFDNQPMVILEAIASGLPVLYADPNLAEVVPDGGGFAAPTPDADGLASVLTKLQRQPELVALASKAMVAAGDSAAVQVGPMVEVYEGVLEASGR